MEKKVGSPRWTLTSGTTVVQPHLKLQTNRNTAEKQTYCRSTHTYKIKLISWQATSVPCSCFDGCSLCRHFYTSALMFNLKYSPRKWVSKISLQKTTSHNQHALNSQRFRGQLRFRWLFLPLRLWHLVHVSTCTVRAGRLPTEDFGGQSFYPAAVRLNWATHRTSDTRRAAARFCLFSGFVWAEPSTLSGSTQ